jgi:hypothetical protein
MTEKQGRDRVEYLPVPYPGRRQQKGKQAAGPTGTAT